MWPASSSQTTAATPTVAKSPTLRSSFSYAPAAARGRRTMRISVRTSVGSMAVWNVSRKKSRAGMSRSPVPLRQMIVALPAMRADADLGQDLGSPMVAETSCSSG